MAAARMPPPPPPTLGEIFAAESSYVWRVLQRLGVQERDLEDIAHEVFIVVQRRLPDFIVGKPMRPWLFGIALRTAMRYRDLAHHRREVLDDDVEATDGNRPVDEQVGALEARILVGRALEELDLPHRAVFLMVELDGHAVTDVATELDIPLNTAYTRLRRARERFRSSVERIRERGRGSHE